MGDSEQANRGVHDAIVVLGADFLSDGSPSPALRRRARHGARLYLEGKAPRLILTGGSRRGRDPIREAEAMAKIAGELGVPREAVVLERRARSTFENARLTAFLMRRRGWSCALLVSDQEHLPRACMAFRAFGITTQGAPVPERPRDLRASLREAVAYAWYVFRLNMMARRRQR